LHEDFKIVCYAGRVLGKWFTQSPITLVEMEYFDKRMAFDVVEDALTSLDTPENRGFASGLCGGFYLCGLLSEAEWYGYQDRIFGKGSPYKAQ
jgi:hypothetical protein